LQAGVLLLLSKARRCQGEKKKKRQQIQQEIQQELSRGRKRQQIQQEKASNQDRHVMLETRKTLTLGAQGSGEERGEGAGREGVGNGGKESKRDSGLGFRASGSGFRV